MQFSDIKNKWMHADDDDEATLCDSINIQSRFIIAISLSRPPNGSSRTQSLSVNLYLSHTVPMI